MNPIATDFLVLNLGHACIQHQWGNEDISSPFVRVYYVKQGRALLHLPTGTIEATTGHMYLIPSYVPHSYICDAGFDFYYLFVYQRVQQQADIFDTYDFPTEVNANEATRLLFENYCDLYPQLNLPSNDAASFASHPSYREYVHAYMKMDEYEHLQLHGMVEILMSYFMKHAERRAMVQDSRMSKLIDYVQQHLHEPITIDQLSDAACLTKSHLIRTFRQSIGVTPLQYVIRKKIQKAQSLLLSTDMTVQQVGECVGMQDSSYFIRLFRKNIGFTPLEYRENLIG